MYFQSLEEFSRDNAVSRKGFYGLSDFPTVFQEHIDKELEFKTPVWLDDIICVTNGTAEEPERELRDILSKLQEAGYRASEKKTELFKKKLTWLGYHINQNGVKPIKDKTSNNQVENPNEHERGAEVISGIN